MIIETNNLTRLLIFDDKINFLFSQHVPIYDVFSLLLNFFEFYVFVI